MASSIPSKLVEMARARRVIPFVGAGFSASLNVPDWDSLLAKLAEDIESAVPHSDVRHFCNNDPLQIAEYYLLISDGRVGPLRHAISTALQTTLNPLMSGMHVELVNLGAPQIYTTNFDDLIERTFRALGQPYEVISLPKHLATSSDAKPQVIKYHGDLRHEQTLVLTESSYYARLDLESPMDIKFRSDLLGRSVLFVGYSFRDINIRIIWFRLMRMMKDIRQEDRPTSFIVTFIRNPVLEKLSEAVGIETISLDPNTKSSPPSEEKTRLLNRFMFDLACASAPGGCILGRPNQPHFYSQTLTDEIEHLLAEDKAESADPLFGSNPRTKAELTLLFEKAGQRVIPPPHQAKAHSLLEVSSEDLSTNNGAVALALKYAQAFGPDTTVTQICSRALERLHPRNVLCKQAPPWKIIRAGK